MKYIFDVDGTLTPPRSKIVPEFIPFLTQFFEKNECYLASGSDLEKITWQLGDLINKATGVFTCSGNVYCKNNVLIYQNNWFFPIEVEEKLDCFIDNSKFPNRYGNHIEERVGCVNFSVCGRNANHQQRKEYFEWDQQNKERLTIATEMKNDYPDLKFDIGGEISIDIYPTGCDKGQIAKIIDSPVTFYGDKICPNGNDLVLAELLIARGDFAVQISDWEHCRTLLSFN